MSDRGLTGANTLAYRGVRPSTPPNLVMHPRRPTVNDYLSFCVGDIWIDSSGRLLTPPVFPGNGDVYMLTSVAGNVASWVPFIGGLMSLSGDIGAHVHGDVNQNIQLTSNIGNLTITGNPGANRLEFDSSGGGTFVEKLISDDFVDVLPAGAGQIYIHGVNGITTTGFGSTVTIDGAGASALTTYTTNAGNAVPAANVLNVLGAGSAVTTGAGNTVTITVPAIPVVPLGARDYSFSVYLAGLVNNVTGDDTHYKILFDTVIFNIGACYNTGTNLFTAPVNGIYMFTASVTLFSGSALGTVNFGDTYLECPGAAYVPGGAILRSNLGWVADDAGHHMNEDTYIIRLNAGDTVYYTVNATYGAGAAKTMGVGGGTQTAFAGALLASL